MEEVMADAEHLAVALGDDAVHRFTGIEETAPGSLGNLVGSAVGPVRS
jgi:hypothetical protein